MSRRLLAIDIGNTHTTLGLFDGVSLRECWRMATRAARTGDELWISLRQFFEGSGVDLQALDAVSISSVVPDLTAAYVSMSKSRLRLEPLVIRADSVRNLRIAYDPPASVGPDRLCGAVAAFAKYGGPLVVVDLGTATVFDVVSADAVYLGGLIAPGLMTALESLHTKAALLPRVEPEFPQKVIGGNTVTAIQSGILNGAVEMVNGLVARIELEVGMAVNVIGTGGFALLLQPHCARMRHVEPDLVLDGIRLITDQQ
ncbi:MAG TPA: type III pantothenate kinase [bacterium]